MAEPDVRYLDPPSGAVRALQAALTWQGHPLPCSSLEEGGFDGCPGPETWAAVDAWCITTGEPWDAQRRILRGDLIERIVKTAPAPSMTVRSAPGDDLRMSGVGDDEIADVILPAPSPKTPKPKGR